MEPIQLRFTQTEKEYLSATRLFIFKSKDVFPRLLVLSFLLAVLLFSIPLLFGIALPIWVTLTLAGLVVAGAYHQILIQYPKKFFKGDPRFHDEYSLTFSEEGVAAKSAVIDSKAAWSVYTGVLENEELYVLVWGSDTRMITIVPKRAFRSSIDERRFRDLIGRHVGTSFSGGQKPRELKEVSEYVPPIDGPPDWR